MILYLASKMGGIPKWNFPKMDKEKERIEKMGHTVVSPADIVRALGLKSDDKEVPINTLETVVLINNIAISKHCDAVVLMEDDWRTSMGVAVEISLCQSLGKPILSSKDLKEIKIDILPWKNKQR